MSLATPSFSTSYARPDVVTPERKKDIYADFEPFALSPNALISITAEIYSSGAVSCPSIVRKVGTPVDEFYCEQLIWDNAPFKAMYNGACRLELIFPAVNGEKTSGNDCVHTFFQKFPELRGKVAVMHVIPTAAARLYPGVVSQMDLHSIRNLIGIPIASLNSRELQAYRTEWLEYLRDPNNHPHSKLELARTASTFVDGHRELFYQPESVLPLFEMPWSERDTYNQSSASRASAKHHKLEDPALTKEQEYLRKYEETRGKLAQNYNDHLLKGRDLMSHGKYEEALEQFDQARMFEDFAAADYAQALCKLGRASEAIVVLDKYLSTHPKDEWCLKTKVDAFIDLKAWDRALKACDDYGHLYDFDGLSYLLRCKVYAAMDDRVALARCAAAGYAYCFRHSYPLDNIWLVLKTYRLDKPDHVPRIKTENGKVFALIDQLKHGTPPTSARALESIFPGPFIEGESSKDGVTNCGRIQYHDLFPRIDLSRNGNYHNNGMELAFEVSPDDTYITRDDVIQKYSAQPFQSVEQYKSMYGDVHDPLKLAFSESDRTMVFSFTKSGDEQLDHISLYWVNQHASPAILPARERNELYARLDNDVSVKQYEQAKDDVMNHWRDEYLDATEGNERLAIMNEKRRRLSLIFRSCGQPGRADFVDAAPISFIGMAIDTRDSVKFPTLTDYMKTKWLVQRWGTLDNYYFRISRDKFGTLNVSNTSPRFVELKKMWGTVDEHVYERNLDIPTSLIDEELFAL